MEKSMKSKQRSGLASPFPKKSALAIAILLAVSSLSAYASNNNPKMHAPYRILPNTPLYAPSGMSPAQVTKAYGFSAITAQGEGQVVAIVDAFDNPNAEADLGTFSSTFGLPACTTSNGCFQKIYASGSKPAGDTGWGVEIALDIQWAHAVAPKAKILLVEAKDNSLTGLMQAVQVAVQKGATTVSMSWGGGEFSGETQYDSYFNVPSVTFTAASGDGGHGVIYPSSSPYVVAVGGTTLNIDSSGNWSGETAWSGSGGGISQYETEPDYQKSFQIPNNPNSMRGVPDVAYNGDPRSGVSVYDSYGQGGWLVVGGTSAGAPQWAGLIAVAQSAAQSKVSNINSLLYTLAKNSYSTMYHDIVSGTNGSCGTLCTAKTGFDYVTGLGSPQVPNLVSGISGGGGGGGGGGGNRIPI